jgi:hypothetical protein
MDTELQEEILWMCEASHVPAIWATCGPDACDARCPPGAPCSAAFITHALVHPAAGTCL